KAAASTEVNPADQPVDPARPLEVQQPGPPPAPVAATPVVPAPLPPEKLDYSSDRGPTEQVMAENNVTEEQLKKGNEPEFGPTLEARAEAEQHEASVEAAYRQQEVQLQSDAEGKAQAALARGLGGIHGARKAGLGGVEGKQRGTMSKDA